jgi:uncharacterized protein (UPF0261 family)
MGLTKKPTVLLVATMDTKGNEARYLEACMQQAGVEVLIMDPGIRGENKYPVTVTREEVAQASGKSLEEIQGLGHEGKALACMTSGAIRCAGDLYKKKTFQGIIGLGGSMGTTLGTGVMRSFPVGLPKVMISTMASRDTRSFVGTKDIMMHHSVCDLSGLNRITKAVLKNGALAIAGMAGERSAESAENKPLIALSTLGTTEACAVQVRQGLERLGNEVVVFHTVGAGGEAMEELIREGEVNALIDLSLHELTDYHYGGDYDAGPERGKAALERGIPTLMVPGNTDFLVTGPQHEAEKRFPGRPFHVHNAAITVVRVEREELEAIAGEMAGLCNLGKGPRAVTVPMGGFSAFDSPEGPLYDPEGPPLFVKTLRSLLKDDIPLETVPCHINDPEFGNTLLEQITRLMKRDGE